MKTTTVFRNTLTNGIVVSTVRYRCDGETVFETAIIVGGVTSDGFRCGNRGAASVQHDEVAMIAGGQRAFDAGSLRQEKLIRMYADCVERIASRVAA